MLKYDKSSPLIKALGALDELNSFLGWLKVKAKKDKQLVNLIEPIQENLFLIGSLLIKFKRGKFEKRKVKFLEAGIKEFGAGLEEVKQFIVPGGAENAAFLHVCRTICRRAESEVAGLKEADQNIQAYLNRLSDLLFVLALRANKKEGKRERFWGRQKAIR